MGTKNSLVSSVRLVLRAGWRLPALLALLYLITGAVLAVELLIIRGVVDELVDGGAIQAGTILRFALVFAAGRISPALARDLQALVTEGVQKTLVYDVLAHAASAPLERLEAPDYQDRLVRAQIAASGHVWAATSGVLAVASSAVASLSLLFILVTVAPALVPVLFAAGLLMVGVAALRGRWQYRFEFDDTEAGRERRYLHDALVSRVEGKEIRLSVNGQLLLERYQLLADRRYVELVTVIRRRIAGAVTSNLALAVALGLCLVVVSNQAAAGSLSLADAAVAVFAANQLASRLNAIANGLGSVMQARLFVADILSFLSSPEPSVEPPAVIEAESGEAGFSLVLDRVSYRYPDTANNAVENVSLRVDKGEIVALVGENGAGKTTLAKVAAGLYAPTAGTVRIETSSTKPFDRSEPVAEVAGVFQDFARYELSVRENVWLGAPWLEPEDEAIHAALSSAGADEFVAELPAGIDTRLGRRFGGGIELSLGQWQRLAIARVVFSDAPLVILDEPTAWLDGESAAAFVSLLTKLAEDRGVLVISHRPDTYTAADRRIRLCRADRNSPGVLQESSDHRPPRHQV